MKKHTSRRAFQRHNIVKDFIFDVFFAISSLPKLLLEVFIRQKMGRRYFRISSAITVLIVMFLIPYLTYEFLADKDYDGVPHYKGGFWSSYLSWYIFTALFVIFSLKRAKETYPQGNVYDYDYFSLSSGYSLPLLENLPFLPKKPSGYMVEVFIEPAFFFVIGLILSAFDQPIGSCLKFCAICYGFSYAAAYNLTDEKIQDIIDGIIDAEEFERSFIYGHEASRGAKSYTRPSDEELRKKMASRMYPGQEEPEDAEFTVI